MHFFSFCRAYCGAQRINAFDTISLYALYCIYSALLAAFFQTRPCCLGWQCWTWVHIIRPTFGSAFQNVPKLSQIIENTSIPTVTVSLNFCEFLVTLLESLIAKMCQITHCHCSTQFICGSLLPSYTCL